ncbi:beta-amyrin 28-monooxygenase-like [Lycium barbarum]|uniref:beta-amyrin 28-monooxygenase-like n=1 Tax=Lycium barbarum TaxID=112863 RepID=UPI00293E228C|nr:beta-amyrin 28-monooxygenase-like [Lycium barbarum]XP_060183701.1 beta-amyrin 28-monooxygenase-like [Lycium barbarum]
MATMEIPALLVIIFIIFILIIRRNKKTLNYPPGSFGWPFLGETLDFLRAAKKEGKPEKFVKDRIEKYKSKIFKTSLMGEKMVVLGSASGNKFLFSNENKQVTVWWPVTIRRILGSCLVTTAGEEAKLMRKMISSFTSPDAFSRLYVKTMEVVAHDHFKNYWEGKEKVKVFPLVKLYTFKVACHLFMSIEDDNEIERLSAQFHIFLKGLISLPLYLPGTAFYKAAKATDALRKELLQVVRKRRETLNRKAASPSQDILSHLLSCPDENGKFMSELVIVNNILLLLFAGHDTSSVTLTLLIKRLAEYPQVYQNILQEHIEIASAKKEGEFLSWDDIQKMKYSWNVVSEVMRLTPPVMGAYREAIADINYEGYHIPKGWKFYWNTSLTSLDSEIFPNATSLEPSRFEGAGPAPYTYVPFGGGARMCLGKEFARLEILIFLHILIRKFSWKLLIPDEKIIYDPMATFVEGLPINLQPHNS